jgi:hypothetical protein
MRSYHLGRCSGFALAAAVAAFLAPGSAPSRAQAPAAEGPQPFVVYTQYSPTFTPGESRVQFSVTVYVQNATQTKFKNLQVRRTFPERFTAQIAPSELDELEGRAPEFRPKIEGNVYQIALPELWGAKGTLLFYQLKFTGRPDEVLFPGAEIRYETDEQPAMDYRSADDLLNLKSYSFFSGTLKDFLKRNAEVVLEVGVVGDAWRLAPVDFKAFGQNPVGVTGINGDLSRGHFRVQAGVPGKYRDLLVVWWPSSKDKRLKTEDEFRTRIKEYSSWVGLRRLADDTIKVTPERAFPNFKGWYAEGAWKDVPKRYGEGPFGAVLFYSPVRSAEFMLFWWVQGRGVGAGFGDVPQPEKDAALMREMQKIVESFKPFQKA